MSISVYIFNIKSRFDITYMSHKGMELHYPNYLDDIIKMYDLYRLCDNDEANFILRNYCNDTIDITDFFKKKISILSISDNAFYYVLKGCIMDKTNKALFLSNENYVKLKQNVYYTKFEKFLKESEKKEIAQFFKKLEKHYMNRQGNYIPILMFGVQ